MTHTPITLLPGAQLESRRIGPITQTDIVRFAGAGGDFNPLHHDPDYAIRAGLPGVISMGQMQAGMLAAWVSDLVHIEHLISYSVRFASPLRIGETIDLAGQVDSIDATTAIATLSLHAKSGDRVVITGVARVRITVSH
ncbi:MaoC family dehydratase N-terminal domain-containing protein [Nocardia nova]|uniref:MaoC/PaaZ C-terminal domain-containing protein n=1 Tax=Nocardia nova TaxID=37330 RepID=UPI001C44A101|nr:MaoC/PaaZ C-terminal domain-containing protein [Nocardia nova]MBV7707093.1 MaoC family dehydratase N-terminal domain-containing protein [Nocardia nova]